MKRAYVGFFALLLIASFANARTWYVLPDSTGDAPTILAAIDSSSSGDSVLVAAGTYYVNLFVNQLANLSLVSESGPDVTILDGSYPNPGAFYRKVVVDVHFCDNFLLEGFTIQNGHPTAFYTNKGAGLRIANGRATVRNNIIRANENDYGPAIFIGDQTGTAGTVIEENQILDNYSPENSAGAYFNHASGPIYVRNNMFSGNEGLNGGIRSEGTQVFLEGNVFTGNTSEEWCVFIDGYISRATGNVVSQNIGSGILMGWGVQLSSNTVVGNSEDGLASASCPEVRSNVSIGNGSRGILLYNSHNVTCNDSWGNGVADYYLEADNDTFQNISADPLFCNPDAGDYSIASESPCAPENSGDCGLIGARDVGCTATSVPATGSQVPTSWGRVKSLFR